MNCNADRCSLNSSYNAAKAKRDEEDLALIKNSTLALENMSNRGPLSTIALALFGSSSFIADRLARPDAFLYPNITYEEGQKISNWEVCTGLAPFVPLVQNIAGENPLWPCLTSAATNHDHIQQDIADYIRMFYFDYNRYPSEGDGIANAFTSAAFLTNEAWLLSIFEDQNSWDVTYDLGADTLVPVISTTGIISVSLLLALFLIALLALALYGALTPRWTDQLDAFAMLRLGASIAEEVQLRISHEPHHIGALDKLPGWVGDSASGNGEVGELQLGAHTPLSWQRKYAAYANQGKQGVDST